MTKRAVALPMIVAIGLTAMTCGREPTPQEVERALIQSHARFKDAHFQYQCKSGEGDWKYICQERHEVPGRGGRGSQVVIQKVGVRIMGTYKGEPQFAISPLPNDGPTPSIEELENLARTKNAQRREQQQRALDQHKPHSK